MAPTSATECNTGDKEPEQSCTAFDPSNSSFFDMSFDFDCKAETGSSDASVTSKLFEEIDLSSSSSHNPADACIRSSTAQIHDAHTAHTQTSDGRQQHHQQHQRVTQWRADSPFRTQLEPYASITQPVPVAAAATQKLVHRFRPDGATISRDDLFSLEGRRPLSVQPLACLRPKTPPASPAQHPSVQLTPKTPRTPKENSSRIQKARNSPHTPKRQSMHPSNYYVGQEVHSAHSWDEQTQHFESGLNSDTTTPGSHGVHAPLSPPPSARIQQHSHHSRLVIPMRSRHKFLEAPGITTVATYDQMPAYPSYVVRDMTAEGHAEHSYEYGSPVSPLTPWVEGYDTGMSFSPVSPLIDESPHYAVGFEPCAGVAQHISSFPSDLEDPDDGEFELELVEQQGFPIAPAGGLMIDFGNCAPSESFESMCIPDGDNGKPRMDGEGHRHHECLQYGGYHRQDQQAQCTCGTASCGFSDTRSARLPAETRRLRRRGGGSRKGSDERSSAQSGTAHVVGTTGSRRRSSSSKSLRASSRSIRTTSCTSPVTTAGASPEDSRAASSALRSGGRVNSSSGGGASGDMFVNFTPSDSRKILTGVAPSGSSKTKARREKEAVERRRKLSEAAQRAVREAGGDWERVAGELVEV